ncbi:MAG: hypothetical protein A2516_04565 [Alphaproteobacteria bacterium RIFOXYD12_FULL_60_8]|nr:MAG: hypothetical protein A2516_04565 [Alphaproteobacteria bacterium RIFOXYD12_FULL_60_8]
MAPAHGRNPSALTPLAERLEREGYRFNFYQAVKVFEALGVHPVGEGPPRPAEQSLRFLSRVGFSFPPSHIDQVRRAPNEISVHFMGLAGGLGPLPAPYAEMVMDRQSVRDNGPKDFLDIFNHRLITLMYRAKQKHRPSLQRPGERRNLFEFLLLSLMGLGLMGLGPEAVKEALAERLNPRALLGCAGLFATPRRSLHGYERVLSSYFSLPVKVRPEGVGDETEHGLAGRWRTIPVSQRLRLGKAGEGLGRDTFLGGRHWDRQGCVEAIIGPLPYPRIRRLLPHGSAHEALCALTRLYFNDRVDVRLRLRIIADRKTGRKKDEEGFRNPRGWLVQVPASNLIVDGRDVGRHRDNPATIQRLVDNEPIRLGWNSFLKTHNFVAQSEIVIDLAGKSDDGEC